LKNLELVPGSQNIHLVDPQFIISSLLKHNMEFSHFTCESADDTQHRCWWHQLASLRCHSTSS